jgi:hypothetical protein
MNSSQTMIAIFKMHYSMARTGGFLIMIARYSLARLFAKSQTTRK